MAVGVGYKNIFDGNGKIRFIERDELIKEELEMLLTFPKNSLFFGNNMGLDLNKYLQLSNNQAVFNLIKKDIEKVLENYRKVRPVNIEMLFNPNSGNLTINLTVSPVNSNRLITQIISMER